MNQAMENFIHLSSRSEIKVGLNINLKFLSGSITSATVVLHLFNIDMFLDNALYQDAKSMVNIMKM